MTNLRRAAAALVLAGVGALLTSLVPSDLTPRLTYGASRVDGEPGVLLHWVLCPGVAPRVVDLEEYSGGGLSTAASVLWQIRSDAPGVTDIEVATYEVGETPAGFYETVPVRRELPDDLVSISAPPGDASATDGMSFEPAELRSGVIYRGDYSFVTPEEFARDGGQYCRSRDGLAIPGLGLATLGLGGALLAGRRHPVAALISFLVLATGVVTVVAPGGLAHTTSPRQDATSFGFGSHERPVDRSILADISAETANPRGDLYVARFLSPGPYAFAVSCSGPSIQIGELADIERGSTGGRQIVGCATPSLVDGAIGDSPDRGDLVEVLVDPNGMADWRVVVVTGSGSVGPFDEP